jgi:hypothetical protein
LRQLAESLPPSHVKLLKRDVDTYHHHYVVPAGLHVKREYLITVRHVDKHDAMPWDVGQWHKADVQTVLMNVF